MRNPPATADPDLHPDYPSIVSVEIENGQCEVELVVNPWEAAQMATKLHQLATMLTSTASRSAH